MLETNEGIKKNNYKENNKNDKRDTNLDNKENTREIEYLNIYIESFPEINNLIKDKRKNKEIEFSLKYTEKIISIYLNKLNNKSAKKNKRISRNIFYLIKILKNKIPFIQNHNRKLPDSIHKIINKFFIIFIFNIFKEVIKAKENNNYIKKNNSILQLNYILNILLNIIGISYITKIINDNILEEILKLMLLCSIAKKIEKKPLEKDEITNMMFFTAAINLIKLVYIKLYIIQNEYTKRQEELLDNVIKYINYNILGSNTKEEKQNYLNKVFLSRNDYKTSFLIDLSSIISKSKSNDIKNSFINLLTDIYSFSFKYKNCMRPTLQLLSPLFININKKDLNEIKNDLNISDFTLSFIDSLVKKEKQLLKLSPCMLKQGFYLGNELSGIICEFNTFESDFIIMIGFKIESSTLENMMLFDIMSAKTDLSQIKFYLLKTMNNNTYELFCEDTKTQLSTKINVIVGKTYIIAFHFKMKGLMQQSIIKINYVRDEQNPVKEKYKANILSGRELKIKNIKEDNLCMYIGCEKMISKIHYGRIDNKFKGFIGDIIIINTKNIKEKIDLEFEKYLLNLEGNYNKIFSLFAEDMNGLMFKNKIINNKNFIELKKNIKKFDEDDHKLYLGINIIISPKFFKIIDYKDDIDYLNAKNNYDYYLNKKSKIFKIKKKYLDFFIKPNNIEEKKNLELNSSLFDKTFHIFENENTLKEFIENDGIYYLCLLFEYYYQILNHLNKIKNKYDIKDIKLICKDINDKILNTLNFFKINIVQNVFCLNNLKEICKFFYQMTITLIQFMEIDIVNIQTIQYLADMLIFFDGLLIKSIKEKQKKIYIITCRKNLFDFLLNPKLYKENDDSYFEKLNFIFLNLLVVIKKNTEKDKIIDMKEIFSSEILNKLLSYTWLLDNDISNNNAMEKKNLLFVKTRENYILLLIEFLKLSFIKDKETINNNNITQDINFNKCKSDKKIHHISDTLTEKASKNSKINKIKDSTNTNTNNINLIDNSINKKEKLMFNYFFDKIMEQKNNQNIFLNLSIIFSKTNVINQLGESEIDKIKSIIVKELGQKNENNNDNKKIIYVSCLLILIEYYFSNYKNDKNKTSNFHKFIRSLDINIDFFYPLISSIKYVVNLAIDIDCEIIQNTKMPNRKSVNYGNNIKGLEKSYIPSFSGLPFKEINIEEIKEKQIIIIIKDILEDIIYLLFKLERKNLSYKLKKENIYRKMSDSSNSSKEQDTNLGKEIFDVLKKNIDIIFRFPNTELYTEIFSFENEICAELFYLKWKLEGKDGQNYVEKAITKYHKDLLLNHCCPFIYKFIFLISNENAIPFESNFESDKNIYQENTLKLKANLYIFILETINSNQEDLTGNNENSIIIYLNNLLNSLILINEEIDYNINPLFKNSEFCESLYKYIRLLENSGLFYSNYYIEINDNFGKIISETIYDIFFAIYENQFNEELFTELFFKRFYLGNEVFTTFYLMDLCKKNILEKDESVKDKLYDFIPEITSLNIFHNNYLKLHKKKRIFKLFLNKKLYPIEKINFSIYFLGKSFLYFDSNLMKNKNELKNFLLQKFLPLLSKDIFRLYTKRNDFYGDKRCRHFPLYFYTKNLFETRILQNPDDFDKYERFFKSDMKVNLKEEYNINYCYSSRLIHDFRKVSDAQNININMKTPKNENLKKSRAFSVNIDANSSFEISNNDINNSTNNFTNNIPLIANKSVYHSSLNDICLNNQNSGLSGIMEDSNSLEDLSLIFNNENEIENKNKNNSKDLFCTFELISKNTIIYKPKNIFFKIIFSEVFKDIMYNDKTFNKIKNTFFMKYRKIANLSKETKQMNYPIRQKNYSNFLEPMIFLQRDFKFYDKHFFPVSHPYINKDILDSNIENIFFYEHKYKFPIEEVNKFLYCELVTRQYIYFGKMYFSKLFIIFESEEDPRNILTYNKSEDITDKGYTIFTKFGISTNNRDNKTSKYKFILIISDDIKEIIKRRTLLVNNSIEISCKNGKSYFFNFFRVKEVEKAYLYFNEINEKLFENSSKNNIKLNSGEDKIKNILSLFRNGKITNYKYLLYLNKLATRTYNDLSQYPVFPWLVLEHDKIEQIFKEKDKNTKNLNFLRNLNYPISLQTERSREIIIEKFKCENINTTKFSCHLFKHYSTSGYIYYYLMRMNPYEQNIITFQNFRLENSERIFNSFNELEEILKEDSDNRELIPDFFCYFDYYINLNCSYLGQRDNGNFNDDFIVNEININKAPSKSINKISSYAYLLYRERKLLNCYFISKIIHKWVDIIFGKNQLPKKKEDAEKSCNIFTKMSYEQKTNFDSKFDKYQQLINQKKYDKRDFVLKMKNKIDISVNFGSTPRQILKESNIYEGDNKLNENSYYKVLNGGDEEILIYFKKILNDNILILKDEKKKSKNKRRIILCENKSFKEKENNVFICKSFNLLYKHLIDIELENIKIPLYNLEYSFSYLYYQNEKKNKFYIPIILTCRYYGNYFKLQTIDRQLNVFCEDFVTCIIGKNSITKNKNNTNFYTGLLNGKLTEWQIKSYLNVKEVKHVYCHKSSITAIEIDSKQKIIITAGQDKFIHIRKLFDFELLTTIDLTYSFGNPIISKTPNIFPSLIKISKLNLLYVLLYDFDSKNTIIRGYNLNGLFFAQTENKFFKDESKNNLLINYISFTRNSNLVIGFYNSNKFGVLEAWALRPTFQLKNIKNEDKEEKKIGTKLIEYDYNSGMFYILYDNEFIIMTHEDKKMKKIMDSF